MPLRKYSHTYEKLFLKGMRILVFKYIAFFE